MQAALVLSTLAAAALLSPVNGTVGTISWAPCNTNDTLPNAECGYAIVPLDYQDPSKGVAKIALGRFNATSGTRKGSIFVNPGGPGGAGVGLATQGGDALQSLVGEEWDIIGFDPRGIGQSEPAVACFPSPEARQAFIANTVIDRSFDVAEDLTDPMTHAGLVQQERNRIGLFKSQFAVCAQTMGELIGYMGTTLVARDIDYITTLIDGEHALLNFYGFSYGTVIGQYLVNLFPERVGHISIDGVVDANVWSNVPPFQWFLGGWLSSTDSVYSMLFDECAKSGPAGCALAKNGDSGADIMARVENFTNNLYTDPLPVPNATLPGELTFGRGRFFWVDVLVSPTAWQGAASAMAAALAGDPTAVLNAANEKELVDLERSAVTCNDVPSFAAPTAEQYADAALAVLANTSRFELAVETHEPDNGCEYWPATPPERFAGPWNSTLKNPVLIVSNTHDPVTSLANGRQVLANMGAANAGLLVQDGPGHTSTAVSSSCTVGYLRAFFANGTLPAAGTVCPIDDQDLFPAAPPKGAVVNVAVAPDSLKESVRRIAKMVLGK
ncbi:TAP-like protein-domain-containing protein [Epithele typhae]|uniref:TAP-like protein-domain-containing protein n=1 Tax=Epithele typhae TaxID=378194 RepID=UPI002008797B|nr:TAP-like protein-domain-containing protein [Epithele typhae]KAH9927997.1 TAP-like protein-domain-containing protein [Epithele typhae]